VSINAVPKRACRFSAPQRLPISIPAQGFIQTGSRQPDRGEGPRCCRLHEELAAIDKISRNGAPGIDSAPGPVDVNESNCHVANAMFEWSHCK
jgi:hypothetical protein